MIVNDIVDKTRKELIVTDFNMSQDSPRGTEKNHENVLECYQTPDPFCSLACSEYKTGLTGTSQGRTVVSSNGYKSVVRGCQRGLVKGSAMTT